MKHRILRINISLFVALFGLIAGIDVQAYDRIELAGDVLVFALPIAAASLTLGFKDGQGALEFGESAAMNISWHSPASAATSVSPVIRSA
jgi:hypothetical protein